LRGSRAGSDRMGRRRKRRTPSHITPRRALRQPPGNPPQPPSSNVDPARHQSPHEAALKGLATLARGWHLRCLPRVPPPKKLPPLPRESPRETHHTPPQGRGRGWGNNKLPSHKTPSTFPPRKTQFGRKPGERVASATRWERSQHSRGSKAPRAPITAKQNHRNTRQNAAFASPRTRHAFTSQPTLAGRHASRQVQGHGAA